MVHYLEVKLNPERKGELGYGYREAVQGMIYHLLPEDLSRWLHDEGIATPTGRWKPFVFSRLTGAMQPDNTRKAFQVSGPIRLKFASPLTELINELGKALLLSNRLRLGSLVVNVGEVVLSEVAPPEPPATLVARSPITIFKKENGRRRYYRPGEAAFSELLLNNLRNKARALGKEIDGELSIEPLEITPRHKKIERYRKLVVEGWMGRYRISAPSEAIWVALTSGLGALGSQGFGFVEVGGG